MGEWSDDGTLEVASFEGRVGEARRLSFSRGEGRV